jgi:serine/threonine protein kinase/tetratricopeptide (TPR) repeat protein
MDPNETRTLPPNESPVDPLDIGLAAAFGSPSPSPLGGEGLGVRGDAATNSHHAAESPGTIIAGKYKLLQQIGEGGMGSVWMADQIEPVKRRVAVKLIRTERGSSKTILSRFEAERQAIALMDHPNIAKLLDAGTTEKGQPFFVMELVKGIPLTDYCDQHKLPIPDRLQLFLQICSAVQHAHQKGIIHRDLKPSNILIESHDGKPVPKVIDFGLAKATSGMQLTENTLFTGFGSVLGTPMYMAPEQANFNAIDVDTRADIYALGVILYELLTGSTPLTRETIKKAQLDEMLKLIREQEAPTPSSRLSTSHAKPTVAANRQTEPLKLGRIVKGELDWIVMKSLSKERERRYETANGFSKDVERFLNHEPVMAGPPGASYRLQKYIQRNKGQVIAASLILLALLVGMVTTVHQAGRASVAEKEAWENARQEKKRRQEADRAQEIAQAESFRAGEAIIEAKRQAHEAKIQRDRAEEETRVALAVRDFLLKDLLSQAEVSNQVGRERGDFIDQPISVFLKRASRRIEGKFDAYPLTEAAIRYTIGETMRTTTTDAPSASVHLKKSYEIRKQLLGADNRETLESLIGWARTLAYGDQHKQSIVLLEEVLAQTKDRYSERDDLVMSTRTALGYSLAWSGEFDRAEQHYLTMDRNVNEAPVANARDRLAPLTGLLYVNRSKRNYPECEKLLDRIDRLVRESDGLKEMSLYFKQDRAQLYVESGKYDLAERIYLDLRESYAKHAFTVSTYGIDSELIRIYTRTKRPEKAEALIRETLAKAVETQLPLYNQRILQQQLADICVQRGNHREAAELFEQVVDWCERVYKKDPEQSYKHDCLMKLTACYDALKRMPEAERAWAKLKASVRTHRTPGDAQYAAWLAVRSSRLLELKQFAAAETELRECLTIRERVMPNTWVTANTRAMLGQSLLYQQQFAKAETYLRMAYRQLVERQADIPEASRFRIPLTVDHLIELSERQDQPEEAKWWRDERSKYGREILPSPVEKK